MRLIELVDAGTLRLAMFADVMVSWYFGGNRLIIASIDMSNKGRAVRQGKRARPQPGELQSLEYYIGSKFYDSAFNIGLVKCPSALNVV